MRIERPGAGSASGHAHTSERMDFVPDRVIRNTGNRASLRKAIDGLGVWSRNEVVRVDLED